MNQQIIFEYLKRKYLEGDKSFSSSSEIYRDMAQRGLLVNSKRSFDRQLSMLYCHGYLEIQWIRRGGSCLYRIKEKVLTMSEAKSPLSADLTIEEYRKLT